ncbi:MAG: hypothetical protein ACRELY_01200, partial [Polyangiaceae bacterium]
AVRSTARLVIVLLTMFSPFAGCSSQPASERVSVAEVRNETAFLSYSGEGLSVSVSADTGPPCKVLNASATANGEPMEETGGVIEGSNQQDLSTSDDSCGGHTPRSNTACEWTTYTLGHAVEGDVDIEIVDDTGTISLHAVVTPQPAPAITPKNPTVRAGDAATLLLDPLPDPASSLYLTFVDVHVDVHRVTGGISFVVPSLSGDFDSGATGDGGVPSELPPCEEATTLPCSADVTLETPPYVFSVTCTGVAVCKFDSDAMLAENVVSGSLTYDP